MYEFQGFSTRSGLRAGVALDLETTESPESVASTTVLHEARVKGNQSEFTICLRMKTHFRKAEYVLMAAYESSLRPVIIIGNRP